MWSLWRKKLRSLPPPRKCVKQPFARRGSAPNQKGEQSSQSRASDYIREMMRAGPNARAGDHENKRQNGEGVAAPPEQKRQRESGRRAGMSGRE